MNMLVDNLKAGGVISEVEDSNICYDVSVLVPENKKEK